MSEPASKKARTTGASDLAYGGLPTYLMSAERMAELKATAEGLCQSGKVTTAPRLRTCPRVAAAAVMLLHLPSR